MHRDSQNEVIRAIKRAEMSKDAFGILVVESTLVSAAAGFFARSWWVFGAVLLALFAGLAFRPIAICLVALFSVGWAAIGVLLGFLAGSVIASVVLGIVGFIAGLVIHLLAVEWVEDNNPFDEE